MGWVLIKAGIIAGKAGALGDSGEGGVTALSVSKGASFEIWTRFTV